MEEVKIRSGTRVKLKHMDENVLPGDFAQKLREFAHKDERIQAIYFFALQAGGEAEQPSLAVALKTGFFKKTDENFMQIVDEIQLILPDDLSVNLYRFGASEFLSRYCVEDLEPLYLRNDTWLSKQKKKYIQD